MANAELKGSSELSYTYQSVVRYHCQVGTLIGSNEVWCTQDGTWSAPPTCEGVYQKPARGRRLLHSVSTSFSANKKLFRCCTATVDHAGNGKSDVCLCRRCDLSPSRRVEGLLERSPEGVLQTQGQHRHRVQTGLRRHRPERHHLRE